VALNATFARNMATKPKIVLRKIRRGTSSKETATIVA